MTRNMQWVTSISLVEIMTQVTNNISPTFWQGIARKLQKPKSEPWLLHILSLFGPIAGVATASLPLLLFLVPPSPQKLPIEALLPIGNTTIELEVARGEREQAMGLKFRDTLESRHGMLFVIGKPQTVNFWMRDVRIPLDIIFVKPDGTVAAIASSVPKCHPKFCPLYSSGTSIGSVIELSAGSASSLGIKPGTVLHLKQL